MAASRSDISENKESDARSRPLWHPEAPTTDCSTGRGHFTIFSTLFGLIGGISPCVLSIWTLERVELQQTLWKSWRCQGCAMDVLGCVCYSQQLQHSIWHGIWCVLMQLSLESMRRCTPTNTQHIHQLPMLGADSGTAVLYMSACASSIV
jgi:hypothetical protein